MVVSCACKDSGVASGGAGAGENGESEEGVAAAVVAAKEEGGAMGAGEPNENVELGEDWGGEEEEEKRVLPASMLPEGTAPGAATVLLGFIIGAGDRNANGAGPLVAEGADAVPFAVRVVAAEEDEKLNGFRDEAGVASLRPLLLFPAMEKELAGAGVPAAQASVGPAGDNDPKEEAPMSCLGAEGPSDVEAMSPKADPEVPALATAMAAPKTDARRPGTSMGDSSSISIQSGDLRR